MQHFANLINEIKACTICKDHLPLGCRPVIALSPKSKIVIIGQAPGLKVHQTGIPWDDASGRKLREWLGVTSDQFYDPNNFALIPMGFCYPGRGKSGDLPPRKECAPQWHNSLLAQMHSVTLTLLIGQYAQNYYLENAYKTLTENVREHHQFMPRFWPLPHPSPRNNIWQKKNPWFNDSVVPTLLSSVQEILNN